MEAEEGGEVKYPQLLLLLLPLLLLLLPEEEKVVVAGGGADHQKEWNDTSTPKRVPSMLRISAFPRAVPPPPSVTTSVIITNSSSSIAFEDPASASSNLKTGVSNLNKCSKPPITIKYLATKFHMPQRYIDHMIKNDQPVTRDTTICRRYCNCNCNFDFNFEFDYVIFYCPDPYPF